MLRVADGMDATRRIARGRGCGGQCADKTALPSSGPSADCLIKRQRKQGESKLTCYFPSAAYLMQR